MNITTFKHLNYSHLITHNVRIGVLNNPSLSPEDIAATFATYSRSSLSIQDLLQKRYDTGASTSSICSRIIDGYGHGSIRGMGLIPIFIEGISMFDAMYIFYECPYQNGQERSTRYQLMNDISSLFFIHPLIQSSPYLSQYEDILYYWMNSYNSLYDETFSSLSSLFDIDESNKKEINTLKSRTLDCLRYLIPMAKRTSIGLVLNGTELSKLISRLNNNIYTQYLSEGLSFLLNNTEGISNLIRYTDSFNEPTNQILTLIKDKYPYINYQEFHPPFYNRPLFIDTNPNILDHYVHLLHPFLKSIESYSDSLLKEISVLIKEHYNHHIDMGNLGRFGNYITINGIADIASLKDLNRHRPIYKFLPLFHKESSIDLIRTNPYKENLFFLPEYLNHPSLILLKERYINILNKGYEMIISLYKEMIDSPLSTTIKYLYPHAHLTSYSYSGCYKDWLFLISLRLKPGGHISYRTLSYDFNKMINKWYPDFPLLNNNAPNPFNKEEFLDRS